MKTTFSFYIDTFNFHISLIFISIPVLSKSCGKYETSGPIANKSMLNGSEGIVNDSGKS